MNIAFVVTFLSVRNPGSILRIYEIAKALTGEGINTTILSPFTEEKKYISAVPILAIPSTLSKVGLLSPIYSLASKLIWSSNFSKMIFSKSSVGFGIRNLRKGLQQIVASQKFDIIHAVQPLAAMAVGPVTEELNIPLVSDLHNISAETAVADGQAEINDSLYRQAYDMEQTVIDQSDALTVVSDALKDYIRAHFGIDHEKSIFVVPPAGTILPQAQVSIRKNLVIYAGIVHAREHVDLFAESIPLINNQTEFYISDFGPDINRIKRIIQTHGNTKVRYVWLETKEQIDQLLQTAKVGIMTSRDDITRQLGPPMKLFDYLAAGTPVVANDVGGWSEIISKERVGILTDDDVKEFSYAINTLLKDNNLWSEMHQNAINLITTKYNWRTVVKEVLIPAYRLILGQNS